MPVIIDGTSGITTPAVDTTTAITAADGGTGLTSAGTAGNVLTSNGTTWTSAAAASGQLQTQLFTAPGTWTKPASCTQVRVLVVGGGGGGGNPARGGTGGIGQAIVPVSAPVTITIGAGGDASPSDTGASGGTSSFGPAVSATGGAGGSLATQGTNGSGTVSVGTALKSGGGGTSTFPSQFIGNILLFGTRAATPGVNPAVTYSITTPLSENGAGGSGNGSATGASRAGGTSGVVVVEFVG